MIIYYLIELFVNSIIVFSGFSENNLDFRKINYDELKQLINKLME